MSSELTVKPRLFVGSSVESLNVAYAIQENLEHSAEVTVWTQGVFELSRMTIQALMQAVDTFDFAVFVFAPDDVVIMRENTHRAARDNVVFELGLFTGGLGEDRAFIITPRDAELYLPTDLAGITTAAFEPNRRDKNLVAALGPACTRIKRAMEESGIRQPTSSAEGLATSVATGLSEELQRDVAQMLSDQEGRIEGVFVRFEQRVASMMTTQRETAKAPLSRLDYLIRNELTPIARGFIKQIVRGRHLTREQYEVLIRTSYAPAIEELRRNGLLVPLRGHNGAGENIPVYWLPPNTKRTVASIVRELPDENAGEIEALRTTLLEVGYALPSK